MSYKIRVNGAPPEGWSPIPLDDPLAVAVYVRDSATSPPRIVVRERFVDGPNLNLEKYASRDAEQLNARVSRAEYISYRPVSQYGQELEFIEGYALVRGSRLYTTVDTADGRAYILELLFSCPHAQYDLVKPEFGSFLRTLEVVNSEA
ncbi:MULTISPECIES: hypothetical protein [Mycobacteroides]|uniref:hypothetical protein n=1 Tax=Mycobacteroides TaxID=670516 RepID=UPI0005DBD3AC|nr:MULTISPECIES: hypothetical protein [Mycobacteroides]CPS21811.1 Uncharacterised protein [Mycobacteroides abscessus]CPS56228.1 Uncharacterised protein [Mycobacteroides abscessus]CPT32943.1 Uncharacterised protein [Mycobacteroides abscessus]CPU50130.1 Uncharacterised protein [Mycobacteroides abscessus]CPV19632.1 Uncharacterised protein [Mycobacteroides abscessus]